MAKEKETEHWWQSKGVIGSIIVVVVLVLRLLGKQAEATAIEQEAEGIGNWIFEAIGIVGAVIAFWGRLTAKKDITI